MAYYWFILLLLVTAWVWAFVVTPPGPNGGRLRTFVLGCLPPLAFPVAILGCGMVFAHHEGVEPPPFVGHLITGLWLVQLPLLWLAVWWWGERWPAVGMSWVCAMYVSLAAWFISMMSISGDWL